jgi:MarR family transcriptional regulator, lower aerobic nicotinate degradation pathway regulator
MADVNRDHIKHVTTQEEQASFAAMPGHLIRRAQQIAVAIFMDECGPLDLTPVQFAALSAVNAYPGIDATRLAGLIALDKPTTGGAVDRLEAKGLVARATDGTDRRIKRVTITRDGKRLLKRAEGAVLKAQHRVLDPLSAAERSTFLQLLTRLVDGNNSKSRAPMRPLDSEG